MIKSNFSYVIFSIFAFLSLALFADISFASTAGPTGGEGLQWEQPIQKIIRSLSGTVAYGFAVLGLVALAAKYSIGGSLGDIFSTGINVVIAVSILMFAIPMLGTLFAGALIP